MKLLLFAFASILISFIGLTPDNELVTSNDITTTIALETDNTILYFWTWGLVENPNIHDHCDLEIQEKYGFSYKSKGHCMMDDLPRLKRYMAHNQAVEKELEIRHGADWRDKYEAAVALCRTDEQ